MQSVEAFIPWVRIGELLNALIDSFIKALVESDIDPDSKFNEIEDRRGYVDTPSTGGLPHPRSILEPTILPRQIF
ncbi:uncharacterized protein N7473_013214 [Penicillium subrubescens]|uniref:uncharacterized protein n=1 Tax=Penicillium subrubescens TaxID=1316194 RepID=UPI0025453CC6|nr:uncharacterized protein N7473_013214 [Penicillium subrubescens]KAJ5873655.1 hypothetical protein N7473_013214 [Penicillium subrubescens]